MAAPEPMVEVEQESAVVVGRRARLGGAGVPRARPLAAAGGGAGLGNGLKIRTSADLEIREVVVCPFS